MKKTLLAAIALSLSLLRPAAAETREQWIELGARIHGAFGAFIPVGIRVGLDAVQKLKADPRGLSVIYYNGEKPPCPCIADGVMIATKASPGQGTLQIAREKAPAGLLAMIIIRNRKTGEGLKYTITDDWLPTILGWNKSDPPTRFDAAMAVNSLFNFEAAPWPSRVVGALVAQQQLCRFSAQSLLTLLEIQATTTRSRDFAMIAQTARILNNRC